MITAGYIEGLIGGMDNLLQYGRGSYDELCAQRDRLQQALAAYGRDVLPERGNLHDRARKALRSATARIGKIARQATSVSHRQETTLGAFRVGQQVVWKGKPVTISHFTARGFARLDVPGEPRKRTVHPNFLEAA